MCNQRWPYSSARAWNPFLRETWKIWTGELCWRCWAWVWPWVKHLTWRPCCKAMSFVSLRDMMFDRFLDGQRMDSKWFFWRRIWERIIYIYTKYRCGERDYINISWFAEGWCWGCIFLGLWRRHPRYFLSPTAKMVRVSNPPNSDISQRWAGVLKGSSTLPTFLSLGTLGWLRLHHTSCTG